jgi:hypothetical protein
MLSAAQAWSDALDDINLQGANQVHLIGVIRGDVDGSWAQVAGSP